MRPGSARKHHSTNARDRPLIVRQETRIVDAIACFATMSYTTEFTVLVNGDGVIG